MSAAGRCARCCAARCSSRSCPSSSWCASTPGGWPTGSPARPDGPCTPTRPWRGCARCPPATTTAPVPRRPRARSPAEGGEKTVGQWRVAYIVEPAEPWYVTREGRQVFREPAAGESHHIEIIPFEAKTGRIVPRVPIRLEVLDAAGTVVDARRLRFYYSEFFHYANNFAVPQAGTYTLRATLRPPTFRRHGEKGKPRR